MSLHLSDQWDPGFLAGRDIGGEVDRRNNDLIGQILKVYGHKRKNKKGEREYSVKESTDEQEYGKGVEKKGSELTSGTVKLMAIFLREED